MVNKTDITIVLDKSGSMLVVREDTLATLNKFIEEQQKVPGDASLTLVTFAGYEWGGGIRRVLRWDPVADETRHDSKPFQYVLNNVPLADVKRLGFVDYYPKGSTALFDTLCTVIDETGQRLARLSESERPSKVMCVIITDGEENNSRFKTLKDVKMRIDLQQTTYSWQFVFLGANQDAFSAAESIGILRAATANFAASKQGLDAAGGVLIRATSRYRTAPIGASYAFTAAEQAESQAPIDKS
jgi:hypothetical protein